MAKKHTRLFNPKFLEEQLKEFSLDTIPNISDAKNAIAEWNRKIQEGIVDTTKEESQNALFAECIFDRALGYRKSIKEEGNDEWNLYLEKKTIADGTKPDLTLGFYTSHTSLTRVVVELKDSSHKDLDKKQNRPHDKRTPVEQAFSYAPKNGEDCKWVIVSNYLEIRLYLSNDSTKYERFYIEKLNTEEEEFKKFIFLLHKIHLISKTVQSKTERLHQQSKSYNETNQENNKHILDKMYDCIKKFNGFGYVNPQILSNAYPFNSNHTNNNYVHEDYAVSTNNAELFEFISKVSIHNNEIIIDDEIKEEVESMVLEANKKLYFIVYRLHNFLIQYIFFNDNRIGDSKVELFISSIKCTCIACNLDNMLLSKAVNETYNIIGTEKSKSPESAYFLYRIPIQNYKHSYLSYKSLRQIFTTQGKEIEYFIATYNQKRVGEIIEWNYFEEDRKELLRDYRNIDLEYERNNIIQFNLDKDVQKALLELFSSSFLSSIDFQMDECLMKLKSAKINFENGGSTSGSYILNKVIYNQAKLYAYVRSNYLVKEYIATQVKIFESSILLHYLGQNYEYGFSTFPYFIMQQTIIHVNYEQIKNIDNIYKLNKILVTDINKNKIVNLSVNLLESFNKKGSFGKESNEELNSLMRNFDFSDNVGNILNNIFFFLNKIELAEFQITRIIKGVINFVEYCDYIANQYLKELEQFVKKKAKLIVIDDLEKLLFKLVDKYNNKNILYRSFMEKTCDAVIDNFPNYRIKSEQAIEDILYKFNSRSNNIITLIYFWHLVEEDTKKEISDRIEKYVRKTKNYRLYYNAVRNKIIDISQTRDLFEEYVKSMYSHFKRFDERRKSGQLYTFFDGTDKYDRFFKQDMQFIYNENLFNDDIVKTEFKDLQGFEGWLVNPFEFDYSEFKIEWLSWIHGWYDFFYKLKTIKELKTIIENHLKENPTDTKISEMYFKFFA